MLLNYTIKKEAYFFMKKAALYIRVSTDSQAEEGYSIELQEEKLKQYAKINNFKITETYIDAGVSGAKSERPALDQLKENIKNFDIVLIYKLDRLSRSMKDTMVLIEDLFKPNSVDLISISENFDTSSAMGMATVGMLSTFAQLERETIKERMVSGKVQSVKNGNYINLAPLGYKKENRKLVKDEANREIVEYIFKRLLEGASTYKVALEIELKKIPCTLKRKWYPATITRIIKNKTYLGHTCLMKKQIENTHEPYISQEDYEKINNNLTKRAVHRSFATNNAFTALFRGLVRCSKCGHRLSVNRQPRKSGFIKIYKCSNCKRDGLESKSYMEKDIEYSFLEKLKNQEMIIDKPTNKKLIKKDYEKELKQLSEKEKKLTKAWFNELISDEELKELKKDIEVVRKDILKEKEQQDKILILKSKEKELTSALTKILEIWHIIDYEEKRELLIKIIDYIEVSATKISACRHSVKVDKINFII